MEIMSTRFHRKYRRMILGKSWIVEIRATSDVEMCLLKLISCDQWYDLKTLSQQPILNEPSSPEEPTPKDSSLKVEFPKVLEPSSEEKVHHEDTHDDKMQPKEEIASQVDHVMPSSKMPLMLLPL